MADIQRRSTAKGGVRWDVRYRDETMAQRKRSFARKVDAQRFASSVETDLLRGDWIDPKRGQEEFALWADKWLATIADRKPKTRESYESIVANDSSNRLRRPTSLERKVMIDAALLVRQRGPGPRRAPPPARCRWLSRHRSSARLRTNRQPLRRRSSTSLIVPSPTRFSIAALSAT